MHSPPFCVNRFCSAAILPAMALSPAGCLRTSDRRGRGDRVGELPDYTCPATTLPAPAAAAPLLTALPKPGLAPDPAAKEPSPSSWPRRVAEAARASCLPASSVAVTQRHGSGSRSGLGAATSSTAITVHRTILRAEGTDLPPAAAAARFDASAALRASAKEAARRHGYTRAADLAALAPEEAARADPALPEAAAALFSYAEEEWEEWEGDDRWKAGRATPALGTVLWIGAGPSSSFDLRFGAVVPADAAAESAA